MHMRQLSAQDAAFLYLESRGAHLHLTSLNIYDQSTAPGGKVRHKRYTHVRRKPAAHVAHIPPKAGIAAA